MISSFKFKDDASIVQAKALHIEEGCMPYRYVLRYQPYQFQKYSVHRENMKLVGNTWEHMEFYWGHYFSSLDLAQRELNRK